VSGVLCGLVALIGVICLAIGKKLGARVHKAIARCGGRQLGLLLTPVIGGVLLGLVAKGCPLVLGDGNAQLSPVVASAFGTYTNGTAIQRHLSHLDATTLFLTALAKMLSLGLALGFGFVGGQIFPLVFAGVCVGSAAHLLVPALPVAMAIPCCAAAVPAAIVPTPISMVALVSTLLALGGEGTAPISIACLVAYTTVCGMGVLQAGAERNLRNLATPDATPAQPSTPSTPLQPLQPLQPLRQIISPTNAPLIAALPASPAHVLPRDTTTPRDISPPRALPLPPPAASINASINTCCAPPPPNTAAASCAAASCAAASCSAAFCSAASSSAACCSASCLPEPLCSGLAGTWLCTGLYGDDFGKQMELLKVGYLKRKAGAALKWGVGTVSAIVKVDGLTVTITVRGQGSMAIVADGSEQNVAMPDGSGESAKALVRVTDDGVIEMSIASRGLTIKRYLHDGKMLAEMTCHGLTTIREFTRKV